ncbi:CDP-diacylglycerol--glycerol-3-phosphate 3-phosphatidyltransferase [Corynebacterium silvaticum]|uniref:CDP-diacylglycerol--glycerol-3-phosphate 3-phosphatidyltransferase n=1 Tax=Corynebacterium silvaticum TaxID=2320431 RepID=A0A7Y4P7Q9_9CORY|nr:CDP-diacylglycerol--glycerol-3-phosphate 3-phosphatidyltransferase [Corynebacterium silvaticum]ARU46333.1 CDP-diacylglycerol--glycerol-3-phosphate 3-phosphatidyltransferase [Corynebacterium silvaticum]MBH5299466.1 CDP-diacylglycerol--glycerol-3-phosphate 3-phosphatidyltransferase [Corynebacterium silvaticum]NOM64215.1 CDP-diacylglycerol--glycerol-3-phosphate 3-phosphatidyltransferase [Corynebacterium silvaticum]NON69422.1 CDP-diacylglycerol--glycerol-3-phosphate 3-phosphatidyltransferase [Co
MIVNEERTVNTPEHKPSNFNVPNVLTSLRIIVIPLFAWLVISGDGQHVSWMWWSLGVFVALMITDKLDGDIARAKNLVTDFGKIADPIADKALMITALVCLNIVGLVGWWVTAIIVVRELGITFWRMGELRKGNVVPASKGGKIKTTLQSLAVALYLIPLSGVFSVVQFLVMLAAVAITVITGVQYLIDARRLNRER